MITATYSPMKRKLFRYLGCALYGSFLGALLALVYAALSIAGSF